MRPFIHAFLLAPHLLALAGDQPPGFQIQPDLLPALTSQDWASVVNARQAPLGPFEAHVERISVEAHDSVTDPATLDARVSIEDLFRVSRPVPLVGALRGFVSSLLDLAISPLFPFPRLPWGPRHHPGEPIDLSEYTIGEIFKWILDHPAKPHDHGHHSLPLHRLAWLINQSEPVQNILSDPNADLTFFAPDDEALTPPHKRGKHGHAKNSFPLFGRRGPEGPDPKAFDDLPIEQPDEHVFWQALATGCPHSHSELDDKDEDKDKKKKILLHLLRLVLTYHVSPGQKSLKEIVEHATVPSALHIESDSSSPAFRIRVGGLPHFTKPGVTHLNFYTEIGGLGPNTIIAKNGVIHLARGFPLLPPLTPLSQLFIYPKRFSTLTSALQQVKLNDILLPSWEKGPSGINNGDLDVVSDHVQGMLDSLVHEHEHKLEIRGFTVFAPTNRAFLALGPHLTSFLFSPFGARVLRYVLSYHIVPDIIWYTDHVDETADSRASTSDEKSSIDFLSSDEREDETLTLFRTRGLPDNPRGHPHVPLHPPNIPWKKVNVTSLSLPTLLGSDKNVSLSISLVEYQFPGKALQRQVFVKQPPGPSKSGDTKGKPHKPIHVTVPDAVAWGGAIHVIPSLIHPPVPTGHPDHDLIQRLFSGPSEDGIEESLFV